MGEIDPDFARRGPRRRCDDEPVKLAAETWENWHRKQAKHHRRKAVRIRTYIGPLPSTDNCELCWYSHDIVMTVMIESGQGKINADICRACAQAISSKIDGILINEHLCINKKGEHT